ncbi:hypothetical protein ACFL0Y_01450 [Patescibacteria group bacterium]
MNEFTAKVKITPKILVFIKKYSAKSELLTPLLESYWKPKGVGLKNFPPGKKVIRLRALMERPEKAVVDELNTFLKGGSYTHDKVRLFKGSFEESELFLEKEGYEKWSEIKLGSIKHKLKLLGDLVVDALEEEINGKKTVVKFEAEKESDIDRVKKLLNLTSHELILKNRAELLAE